MISRASAAALVMLGLLPGLCLADETIAGQPLPGTQPLTMSGDVASHLVEGVDRFLLRETEASQGRRAARWNRDFSSPEMYARSVRPQRERLKRIVGIKDERPFEVEFELMGTVDARGPIATSATYDVLAVRWSALADVHATGLLLRPKKSPPKAFVVAVPDADRSPESLAGIEPGTPPESQYARRLAEAGCEVLIPTLLDRKIVEQRGASGLGGVKLTTREFVYRSAFELGRHPLGYELQMIQSAFDVFTDFGPEVTFPESQLPFGVIGWGEGGLLALYAGALDERINAVCVSGYFDDRRDLWKEPIDRNLFGLLEEFGDAEVASLVLPRGLVIEAAAGPSAVVEPGGFGGPGRLETPNVARVRSEFARLRELAPKWCNEKNPRLIESGEGNGPNGSRPALEAFLAALGITATIPAEPVALQVVREDFDAAMRRQQWRREVMRHHEQLLRESPLRRAAFMKDLKTSSLEEYRETSKAYREKFANETIGRFPNEVLPANPRTRVAYDKEKWTGYEVVLDVFPDVIAYGVLLKPKDMKEGERRPVVVCQHGLEGRPQDVIEGNAAAYHDYAAKLCERGFVVFAPQNLYIFKDRFRTLQRKANPLGKTLFSVIVPQHQQIVDWLQTLPFVDPDRIGFYGLSYGGKSAMRIPALVEDYALSICSADFNDWVEKNASTSIRESYVWTNEYEIFEFDLGETFNYAEMAALIAPRPFMVERGHFDGVGTDDAVGREFARVQHLYQARLKLNNQCRIEWFDGPHTINGQGTFEFLHEKLKWPAPAQ